MKQVVHAPCGPVMGVQNKGVYQFHGIPYAQPPVGPLRFKSHGEWKDGKKHTMRPIDIFWHRRLRRIWISPWDRR